MNDCFVWDTGSYVPGPGLEFPFKSRHRSVVETNTELLTFSRDGPLLIRSYWPGPGEGFSGGAAMAGAAMQR